MRGGILATQALVSNDVNFINAGGGGVVDAVLGGAEIYIVAAPINQEPQVWSPGARSRKSPSSKARRSRSTVSPVRRSLP